MTIYVKFDDTQVLDVLRRLRERMDDLRPVMQDIGEYLVVATKQRFAQSVAPDGTPWQRNTEATYLRFLGRHTSITTKKGKLNARGIGLVTGKKPLIGESERLRNEISIHASAMAVEIGSALEYAATQQFGAAKGAFGTTKRGSPIPWGNIPPRPFLGLSESDTANVLDIVRDQILAMTD